jgi:phospholipid/cholesterol/gamma-HCH transport system permease protein
VNVTLVKELGPVLAATMLAGRVGSAIAAEIGTMKVTEQIDALRALGADPIAYLVVPRFLACVCLIPALTVIADAIGIFGGCIAILSCHRGFHCTNGAEGVGRAATQAFVYSFIAILVVDFFAGMILIRMYWWLFPAPVSLL